MYFLIIIICLVLYNYQRTLRAETKTYTCPLHPLIHEFDGKHVVGAQPIFVMGKQTHFLWWHKRRLGYRTSVFYSWSCPNQQCNPAKFLLRPFLYTRLDYFGNYRIPVCSSEFVSRGLHLKQKLAEFGCRGSWCATEHYEIEGLQISPRSESKNSMCSRTSSELFLLSENYS